MQGSATYRNVDCQFDVAGAASARPTSCDIRKRLQCSRILPRSTCLVGMSAGFSSPSTLPIVIRFCFTASWIQSSPTSTCLTWPKPFRIFYITVCSFCCYFPCLFLDWSLPFPCLFLAFSLNFSAFPHFSLCFQHCSFAFPYFSLRFPFSFIFLYFHNFSFDFDWRCRGSEAPQGDIAAQLPYRAVATLCGCHLVQSPCAVA